MFGNYPVNDDWVFFWQVKAFTQGVFKLNAELDPSFVSQGIIGLLWSYVFGLNYVSLQVLTFTLSLGTALFTYLILNRLGTRKIFAVFGALTLFLNPLFFASSFTFMTDNYLLFFLAGASYFFLKYVKSGFWKDLMLGSLFGFLATMTRQVGVLIFIPVFWFIFRSKKNLKEAALPAIFFIISILTSVMWPRFGANKRFIELEDVGGRLNTLVYIPQYFLIFLSPALMGISTRVKGQFRKISIVLLTLPAAYFLYKTDLFPMGNVLYLEELYTKSDFRTNFSLFDNVFTKLFLSLFWGAVFARVVVHITENIKKIKSALRFSPEELFLFQAGVLSVFPLFISSDMYDRYLLPSIFFLLIFSFSKLRNIAGIDKYLSLKAIFILATISIVLQWDFSSRNRTMWGQVEELRKSTGYSTSIDLNDTYINHTVVRESGDFTGLEPRRGSFEPVCFIQDYTIDTSKPFFKKVESLSRVISAKGLENPKPPTVRKKTLPRIKNNLNKLVYNEEYPSLVYGLVGKKAYVGSFCVNADKD